MDACLWSLFLSAPECDLKGKGRALHVSRTVITVSAFGPSCSSFAPLFPIFSIVLLGVVLSTE